MWGSVPVVPAVSIYVFLYKRIFHRKRYTTRSSLWEREEGAARCDWQIKGQFDLMLNNFWIVLCCGTLDTHTLIIYLLCLYSSSRAYILGNLTVKFHPKNMCLRENWHHLAFLQNSVWNPLNQKLRDHFCPSMPNSPWNYYFFLTHRFCIFYDLEVVRPFFQERQLKLSCSHNHDVIIIIWF